MQMCVYVFFFFLNLVLLDFLIEYCGKVLRHPSLFLQCASRLSFKLS